MELITFFPTPSYFHRNLIQVGIGDGYRFAIDALQNEAVMLQLFAIDGHFSIAHTASHQHAERNQRDNFLHSIFWVCDGNTFNIIMILSVLSSVIVLKMLPESRGARKSEEGVWTGFAFGDLCQIL